MLVDPDLRVEGYRVIRTRARGVGRVPRPEWMDQSDSFPGDLALCIVLWEDAFVPVTRIVVLFKGGFANVVLSWAQFTASGQDGSWPDDLTRVTDPDVFFQQHLNSGFVL